MVKHGLFLGYARFADKFISLNIFYSSKVKWIELLLIKVLSINNNI